MSIIFESILSRYLNVNMFVFMIYRSISANNKTVSSSLTNKDEWYYNMKHKYCGIAIIFNHHKFEYGNHDPRHGSEVDGFNLKASLEKLGFCVTEYVDLTLKKLDKKISLCMLVWFSYKVNMKSVIPIFMYYLTNNLSNTVRRLIKVCVLSDVKSDYFLLRTIYKFNSETLNYF